MSCITGLRLDWTMPGGHGWKVDSIPSVQLNELRRIIRCSFEWYYRCIYLKVLVIFVMMSFSATYLRQSTSLLRNFPMLNHVQTLHNIESSNTPSYESGTSMYMSSAPSQNASSIFPSDSGLSYLLSDELSCSPPSRPVLWSPSDIDNEILVIGYLHDILFHQFSTGSTHQFSQMTLISWGIHYQHGIPSFNLTLNYCRYALIYHIFEGFWYIEQDVAVLLEDSHTGKPWPRMPLI